MDLDLRWLNEGLGQDAGSQASIKTVLETFGIYLGCVFEFPGRSWAFLQALLEDFGPVWMNWKRLK